MLRRRTSERFDVIRSVAQPFATLLCVLLVISQARAGIVPYGVSEPDAADPGSVASQTDRRIALVIGVSDYEHLPELQNPRNDAAAVAAKLSELGFTVIGLFDPTLEDMRDGITQFSRKSEDADIGVFYYAGHAIQLNGENFFFSRDAGIDDPSDLPFESIEFGLIARALENGPRVAIAFLDACRDNPFGDRGRSNRLTSTQGLAPAQSGVGMLIAYATKPNGIALDGAGEHSPFTEALLKHISTPGLELRRMMSLVRKDVVSATNGLQVPWDHSSLIADLYLQNPAPPETAEETVVPSVAPSPVSDVEQPEQEPISDATDVSVTVVPMDSFLVLSSTKHMYAQPIRETQYFRAMLPPDVELEITGRVAGTQWYRVAEDGNVLGYLVLEDDEFVSDRASNPLDAKFDAVDTVLVAERSVNLRAAPSLNSERVGTLAPGSNVVVTGFSKDGLWCRVDNNKSVGYALMTMLEEPPPHVVRGSFEDKADPELLEELDEVMLTNSLTVVRQAPDVLAPKVQTLQAGVQIIALGVVSGANWVMIEVAGESEYVVAEHLSRFEEGATMLDKIVDSMIANLWWWALPLVLSSLAYVCREVLQAKR